MKNMNEENEGDIVTMVAENGETFDFVEIAGISLGGKYYAILKPVSPPAGMAENEAFVFEASGSLGGQTKWGIVYDDDIIDAVMEEYYSLLKDDGNDNQ